MKRSFVHRLKTSIYHKNGTNKPIWFEFSFNFNPEAPYAIRNQTQENIRLRDD